MHPYRGIVCTYRRTDGLFTRPDYHNTLTHQSSDKNDAPGDPLHGPVTSDFFHMDAGTHAVTIGMNYHLLEVK